MSRWSARTALVAAFVVCAASLVPLIVAPTIVVRGGFDFDRIEDAAHGVAAALMVITLVLVQPRPRSGFAMMVAASITGAAAVVAELAQMGVPGRSPALVDLAIDGVGVVAGLALIRWAQHRLDPARLRWVVTGLLVVLGIGTAALVQ